MHILFTTHQGNLAGSTYSIYYLARGLAEKGHRVHIASAGNVLLRELLRDLPGVICHEVPFASYLHIRSILLLRKIIREHGIELINAQGGRDRNLTILIRWIFRLKVRLVFTRRQRPRNEPWIKRWFHLSGADRIVMISEGLKRIFVQKGYPASKLVVIKNGVPGDLLACVSSQKVEQLRLSYRLTGEKVIGCVSRKKSQEQLINALKSLPADVVVLFVGIDEDEIDWSLINQMPGQRLIFTGKVDHQEALCHFPLMDVMVLPSYLDGFGLVLVEAMLSRVAIIGSDFGGIPDIIRDGQNGFLFTNGEIDVLAARISCLLTDEPLRAQFVHQGYEDALQNFLMDRVIAEYEQLFQSLIASS